MSSGTNLEQKNMEDTVVGLVADNRMLTPNEFFLLALMTVVAAVVVAAVVAGAVASLATTSWIGQNKRSEGEASCFFSCQ